MRLVTRRSTDLRLALACHTLYLTGTEPPASDSIAWYTKDHSGGRGRFAGYATARQVGADMLFLNSAGVTKDYRGLGIHRRLINARVKYARKYSLTPLTYTSDTNYASMNNLMACGFRLYRPEWAYAGKQFMYWIL